MIIWPVLHLLPLPNFMPKRFPAESRPFVVEPPPKFVAHLFEIDDKMDQLEG